MTWMYACAYVACTTPKTYVHKYDENNTQPASSLTRLSLVMLYLLPGNCVPVTVTEACEAEVGENEGW